MSKVPATGEYISPNKSRLKIEEFLLSDTNKVKIQNDVIIIDMRIRPFSMERLAWQLKKKHHKEVLKSANSKHQNLKENGFIFFKWTDILWWAKLLCTMNAFNNSRYES